ncbi:MAG TPA: MG2 domain-containing protein [Kofleriaceae bacterium]|nr:MG2 domain-containing protein [Kofleriaceae bacterium]
MRLRVAVCVVLAACGSHRSQHELHVMSYGPQRPIDKAEPIELRFDQPVVPAELVGTPALPDAITVRPAFAWKGYWQDRQTLIVEATAQLAPATRYQVALGGQLAARADAFSFSFVHRPLEVEGVWGIDANALPTDGDVPVSFNLPVNPKAAAAHCKLTADKTEITLVPADGSTAVDSTNVALRPLSKLAPGGAYVLACAGLTAAGGNAPLDKPYALAVHARPLFSITGGTPKGDDVSVDQAEITIELTTPVELDAVRKALSSSPKIAGLDLGTLSTDGTEYKVTTDLDVTTDYAIRIKHLADKFGQQLQAPFELKFHTGDASPRISMQRGIFALEASAKGYPLWSRNVGTFAVQCAEVPKQRLVQALTTDMNYDPWGGNDDAKPIDWSKLKLKPKTQTRHTNARNKWLLSELDFGATCGGASGERGVYLAEISSDEVAPDTNSGWSSARKNRVLANVTDLGVMIEAGTSSGIVWVTSLSSGKPVADAAVTVFTPAGKQVFAGTSDANGLVKLPGTATLKDQPAKHQEADDEYDWDSYRTQRLIATVEKAGDLAVVDGNWSNGIQVWNFGLQADRGGGAVRMRGFIQSDRGLYRPGEDVHFKGLVREIGLRGPSLPSAKSVTVEVTDSRGQTVKTAKAKLSAFGGFAFDMSLSGEAVLGDYFVAATIGDQTFREQFTVEDFRPAAFEIKLASTKATPRPGERLAFDLDVGYLFGAPVANAKVEWNLRRRKHHIAFKGFEEYTFSANPEEFWWGEQPDDYGELVGDGEDQTNDHGHLAIATRDPEHKLDGPVDYILGANVTDSTDQTLGKSVVVTAHQTQFYLGMHANEFVQAVGMPFGVNLVALQPDGARIAAKAHLSFTRDESSCTWFDAAYRSYAQCDTKQHVMLERDVDIADAGSHTERIDPTEPGEYTVKLETKDAAGHAVVAASEIWVIGKGEAFWSGDEGDRMTVVASKPTYEVGDTARLVAQANLESPTALVTIERDGIIDARVIELASPSQGIELPIVDAWAPNVYASIAMVSGRHGDGDRKRPLFKMGMVELKVASSHKQLDVAVKLDADHVRPGDPVSGKIIVTHDGKPISAEVSLSAADEGVLQLIAYETPNPMKTFYAPYGLGVDAATNWNRVARLADPNAGDPDQGGDRKSHGNGQRVRSKFVASAFWAPSLVTDEHGEIAFNFTAPDNLTAFRLMAVAADATDRFGAGELRLTVDKPLMAIPTLPRFLDSGDTATVGVMIENHTAKAGVAVIKATAVGVSLDAHERTVAIAANGSARVRFVATAAEVAAAKFEFAVAMNDDKDDVAVTIPVQRPRVVETTTLASLVLDAGSAWSSPIAAGSDVLANESKLVVTIDRTGVGELAPSLHSLVEYPYGCLEQTLSKFVPLVAAKQLAKTLDDPSLRGSRAEEYIHAGIAKVIRHQQGDGLFSLWPASPTYPQLAAYALWGLTVAQQAGESVPNDVFDRGIKALQDWSNQQGKLSPNDDGATLAMAAYVMALRGKPDASLNARIFAVRNGLPKWGQAFLLRAMVRAKADAAQTGELQKLIEANVEVKAGRALVHEARADERDFYMDTDVRASAMVLAALLDVDPKSALVEPLAAGLLAARDHSGYWSSTQENLWSLVALAQYARTNASGDTTATIAIAGKQVSKKRLVGGEISVVDVPLAHANGQAVSVTTDHGAHVSVRVSEARIDPGAAAANGFTIARTYEDEFGHASTTYKAGQLVRVVLTVSADANHRWVAIEDPLPAGLEIIDPKLATSQVDEASKQATEHHWWEPVSWDYHEARDASARWFADMLPAGRYTLEYEARATTAGTFTAMPTTAQAMYAPDVRGRGPRVVIAVTK